MTPSRVSVIWNRAVTEGGGTSPREGDIALAALLQVHDMVLCGGLDHAVGSLSANQIDAGVLGFRYFQLPNVAAVVEAAVGASEEELDLLTVRYSALVPSDSTLAVAFEAFLAQAPEAFSPVSS